MLRTIIFFICCSLKYDNGWLKLKKLLLDKILILLWSSFTNDRKRMKAKIFLSCWHFDFWRRI